MGTFRGSLRSSGWALLQPDRRCPCRAVHVGNDVSRENDPASPGQPEKRVDEDSAAASCRARNVPNDHAGVACKRGHQYASRNSHEGSRAPHQRSRRAQGRSRSAWKGPARRRFGKVQQGTNVLRYGQDGLKRRAWQKHGARQEVTLWRRGKSRRHLPASDVQYRRTSRRLILDCITEAADLVNGRSAKEIIAPRLSCGVEGSAC